MFGMDMMLKNMGIDLSEIPVMVRQAREMGEQLGAMLQEFRERLARIEKTQGRILQLLENRDDRQDAIAGERRSDETEDCHGENGASP